MKTHLTSIILTLAISVLQIQNSKGQKFYAGLQSGYHLPANTQQFLYYEKVTDDNEIYKTRGESFGQGFKSGAFLGYKLNNNLSVELNIGYAANNSIEHKRVYIDEYFHDVYLTTFKSRSISATPTLAYTVHKKRYSPYAKLGLMLAKNNLEENRNIESTNPFATGKPTKHNSDYNVEYSGGLSTGLSASLGTQFKVSNKIVLFAEANMINMNFNPEYSKVTKFTADGADQMSDWNIRDKETEYNKEIKTDFNNPPSKDKPERELAFSLPFSSVGLNLGIIIPIGH